MKKGIKLWVVVILAGLIWGGVVSAETRSPQTDPPIPLIDMPPGITYEGLEGGLYPGSSNTMPAAHAAAGLVRAKLIQPLDSIGNPDAGGKIVMLSIGVSHGALEFCSKQSDGVTCLENSFMVWAAADTDVNHSTLQLLNGAQSGQSAEKWNESNDSNYNRLRDDILAPNGATEAQVQVFWINIVNRDAPSRPSLPDPAADVYLLASEIGEITRVLAGRYPNLQQVYFSSRIYGGYGGNHSPEPYAYESAYAVKWLVGAQIEQMASGGTIIDPLVGDMNYHTSTPWVSWGPYMWADGANPRSDGLVWILDDYLNDGSHPSLVEGLTKTSTMMIDFFKTSPQACWFTDSCVWTPTGVVMDEVSVSAEAGTTGLAWVMFVGLLLGFSAWLLRALLFEIGLAQHKQ